jgi:hypothetical protein
MPVVAKHSPPTFWIPSNAMGKAATIDGAINNNHIKLNFYWSGVGLATRSKVGQLRLHQELDEFMLSFILQNGISKHI